MELKGGEISLVPLAAVALKGEVVEMFSLVGHETLFVIAVRVNKQLKNRARGDSNLKRNDAAKAGQVQGISPH